MRISRRTRLTVVLVVAVAMGLGRWVESRRLAAPVAAVATSPQHRLDAERLRLDLEVLASRRFGGRATDTPGGLLAAELVDARFRELGLTPFAGGFEQPFTFEHRSIRALWRRNRPFRNVFTEARNVVGYVPGTAAPDSFIVVSAHFDHLGIIGDAVYPGADDNASGTAALLALAAWVRAHPLRHSVVFAAFDAEELGLRGARAFVGTLPFPREQLGLNVNMDMIGRADDGRLFVAGVRYTPALRGVVEAAARESVLPVHAGHDRPMYLTGMISDWTSASDHGAFHDIDVPFLYFGVEDHADVHQPTDTADRVDARFFTAAAETVLSAVIAADGVLR